MKIALLGYGKMGRVIEQLAVEAGHTVVATRTRNHAIGTLADADVAIEFSAPEAAVNHLKECIEAKIPVVCGTTGWLEHYPAITALCQRHQGALVYASNFSIGVQLFFHLNEHLAHLMKDYPSYKPSIEEIHHVQKLDAPSGTAISLSQPIIEFGAPKQWSLDPETDPETLSIKAIRQGQVNGTHSVRYQSPIDTIEITHQAHSREGFAHGALMAAEWITDKTGVFSMKDVLNLT